MFCYAPYGILSFGEIFPEDDLSVPDVIWKLLSGDGLNIRYLVEVYPYSADVINEVVFLPPPFGTMAYGEINSVTYGGTTVIRLSDHQFITEPDDESPNEYYFPVVDNALSYDMRLFRGNDIGINYPTFGAIEIANGDGVLDNLSNLNFNGRRIVVKAGYDGFRYDDYSTVFDGLVNNVEYDDRGIILSVSDKGLLLDRQIITPSYAATGGLEGNVDLLGRMKPLAFGKCFNVEPVLVDPVNLIYQCHAWSMESVSAVYDAGVELAFDADVSDITMATPASGEYATSLATGFIKLGSTPAGRITADIEGDNQYGYSETIGEICIRMALTLYSTLSFMPDEMGDGWPQINAVGGVYLTEQQSLREIFDRLLNPCVAYWYFNRFGRLSANLIDMSGTATGSITTDQIDTSGIQMALSVPPSWKISVAYSPVFTLQSEDELAGATVDTHRTFVGNAHRMVTYENRSIRTAHANPLERTFFTNISEKADAEELLERLVRLYGQERRVFRGTGYQNTFRISLGDKVNLDYPRYGVNGQYTVVGVSMDAKSGQTIMELWG